MAGLLPAFAGTGPRGSHSSGTPVAKRLEQPTRMTGPKRTGSFRLRKKRPRHPYLALLPVGFAVPLLLPAARCALTAPFHPYPVRRLTGPRTWRFVLCGTFPGVAPAGRYPAPFLRGARTFLGGSTAAAARPTDGMVDGGARAPGQEKWRGSCEARHFIVNRFRSVGRGHMRVDLSAVGARRRCGLGRGMARLIAQHRAAGRGAA